MRTLAISEDLDETPHNGAFHQGLHCLPRQNQSLEAEIQFYLDNITCYPSIYTMDHSKFIVSIQKEEFISAQRVSNVLTPTYYFSSDRSRNWGLSLLYRNQVYHHRQMLILHKCKYLTGLDKQKISAEIFHYR